MRINRFIAQTTGMSRRTADKAIEAGSVKLNGKIATPGDQVGDSDSVLLDDRPVKLTQKAQTIMLNKPVGYICSRDGQGNRTVYDLLPDALHHLKLVGRLDKETSGLLLLSSDGDLAQQLTHPRYEKAKTYIIALDRSLSSEEIDKITGEGIDIGDERSSSFELRSIRKNYYEATLKEGRNRQIRRTFEAINCHVIGLHRTTFGTHTLDTLKPGAFRKIDATDTRN